MLERHRVDDVNGSIRSRAMSKEQTVDFIMRIFERMTDNLGEGEVIEVKVWAGHAPIARCVRIGRGLVPGRRYRDAGRLMRVLELCHFLFFAFLSDASITLLSVRLLVPISPAYLVFMCFST